MAQVGELFASLGASPEDVARLASEGVDGQALVLLSYDELGSELGLKLGVRKKFALFLEQQKTASAAAPAPAPAPAAAAVAAAPAKPRPGPAARPGTNRPGPAGPAARVRGAATIRRMSAQVDAELENMLAGLDDI